MTETQTEEQGKLLTPTREALNLHKHGTTLATLTPAAICQAARADLQHWWDNQEIKERRLEAFHEHGRTSAQYRNCEPYYPYAFLPLHVARSKTTADVLRKAIAGVSRGREKGKSANTLRVYDDVKLLMQALTLATQKGL